MSETGIDERLIAAWLQANQVDSSTRRGYVYFVGLFGAYLEKRSLDLASFSRRDMEDFGRALSEQHPSSLAHAAYNVARRFCRWAAQEGLIRNARAIPLGPAPRWDPYSRLPVAPEDVAKLIENAGDGRMRAILSLMARADAKPRDIVGANLSSFAWFGGLAEFELSNGEWLPLTAACASAVSAYAGQRESEGAASDDPLFVSQGSRNRGRRLSQRHLRHLVSDSIAASHLPLPAGDYNLGLVALPLAIAEGEPLETILAISDKTWNARRSLMRTNSLKEG